MARANICYHSLRLNLDREQHQRVEKILADLNTKVHKSVNQFVVDAIDFYIRSLDGDSLVAKAAGQQAEEYVTKKNLADIRKEIREEIKEETRDEVVRLFGLALGGGRIGTEPLSSGKEAVGTEKTEEAETVAGEENSVMAELASRWG